MSEDRQDLFQEIIGKELTRLHLISNKTHLTDLELKRLETLARIKKTLELGLVVSDEEAGAFSTPELLGLAGGSNKPTQGS